MWWREVGGVCWQTFASVCCFGWSLGTAGPLSQSAQEPERRELQGQCCVLGQGILPWGGKATGSLWGQRIALGLYVW